MKYVELRFTSNDWSIPFQSVYGGKISGNLPSSRCFFDAKLDLSENTKEQDRNRVAREASAQARRLERQKRIEQERLEAQMRRAEYEKAVEMERLEREQRIEEARLADEKARADRDARVAAYQAEVEAENQRRY